MRVSELKLTQQQHEKIFRETNARAAVISTPVVQFFKLYIF